MLTLRTAAPETPLQEKLGVMAKRIGWLGLAAAPVVAPELPERMAKPVGAPCMDVLESGSRGEQRAAAQEVMDKEGERRLVEARQVRGRPPEPVAVVEQSRRDREQLGDNLGRATVGRDVQRRVPEAVLVGRLRARDGFVPTLREHAMRCFEEFADVALSQYLVEALR